MTLLSCAARFALFIYIVSNKLQGACHNDYGGVFSDHNCNPLTLFDYDTVRSGLKQSQKEEAFKHDVEAAKQGIRELAQKLGLDVDLALSVFDKVLGLGKRIVNSDDSRSKGGKRKNSFRKGRTFILEWILGGTGETGDNNQPMRLTIPSFLKDSQGSDSGKSHPLIAFTQLLVGIGCLIAFPIVLPFTRNLNFCRAAEMFFKVFWVVYTIAFKRLCETGPPLSDSKESRRIFYYLQFNRF